MAAEKPLRVTNRSPHPYEQIGRNQPNALADKLEGRPYGVTVWGFQKLLENPAVVTDLIQLLGKDPETIKVELARMVAERQPILPLFAEKLYGWEVVEDWGQPLPADWDPRPFLKDMTLGCVHPEGQAYMKGEDIVTEARNRLAGRGGFSQHEMAWFYHHWGNRRIPPWFRNLVESGKIILIATETILLHPDGGRYGLCMYWGGGRLRWRLYCLDEGGFDRCCRILVPGKSPD